MSFPCLIAFAAHIPLNTQSRRLRQTFNIPSILKWNFVYTNLVVLLFSFCFVCQFQHFTSIARWLTINNNPCNPFTNYDTTLYAYIKSDFNSLSIWKAIYNIIIVSLLAMVTFDGRPHHTNDVHRTAPQHNTFSIFVRTANLLFDFFGGWPKIQKVHEKPWTIQWTIAAKRNNRLKRSKSSTK